LASGRQYGNALLKVRHQEEEEEEGTLTNDIRTNIRHSPFRASCMCPVFAECVCIQTTHDNWCKAVLCQLNYAQNKN